MTYSEALRRAAADLEIEQERDHLREALNAIAHYPDAWHHAQDTLKRLRGE